MSSLINASIRVDRLPKEKFISGPKSIKILVNNIAVDPIDPFFKNNKGYQEGPIEQHYTLGGKIIFNFRF